MHLLKETQTTEATNRPPNRVNSKVTHCGCLSPEIGRPCSSRVPGAVEKIERSRDQHYPFSQNPISVPIVPYAQCLSVGLYRDDKMTKILAIESPNVSNTCIRTRGVTPYACASPARKLCSLYVKPNRHSPIIAMTHSDIGTILIFTDLSDAQSASLQGNPQTQPYDRPSWGRRS
jgi:hypothetical protein